MIEAQRYCPDILVQTRAIQSAIRSLERSLLERHIQHCVSQAFQIDDPDLHGTIPSREKVGALSSEAKASAWIIGSLPPGVGVMVSIMSPDYMTPLLTTPMGHFLLLGGGVWMLTGILVMRSMINFKM